MAEDMAAGTEPGEGCQEVIDKLYHYLDHELSDSNKIEIERHLDDCSPCLEVFDFEAELKIFVARNCRDQVPEQLRNRIAKALDEASAVNRSAEK